MDVSQKHYYMVEDLRDPLTITAVFDLSVSAE